MASPAKPLTLNDEQWGIILKELPRAHPLKDVVRDLRDDAATWGEATGEFSEVDTKFLDSLGLPWLESLLESA